MGVGVERVERVERIEGGAEDGNGGVWEDADADEGLEDGDEIQRKDRRVAFGPVETRPRQGRDVGRAAAR